MKKFGYLFCACLLVLGLLPTGLILVGAETVADGTCGEALTWTLDDAGTLTIDGKGDMDEWNTSLDVPWHDYAESVLHIAIGSGVTRIGPWAFTGCRSVETLDVPAGVEAIGAWACADLPVLREVHFPAGLRSIGDGAFLDCAELGGLTLPDSLEKLGDMAFSGCRALASVQAGGATYKSVDGVLYSADGATLLLYPAGKAD